MTPAEADLLATEKLGVSPRARHSRQVGRLMAALAQRFSADRDLWTVVGLVHDIDYFAVKGDWTQHGVLTASWLKDQLPQEALQAIAAHDHRTGVGGDGLLFHMLKFADAMANAVEQAGAEELAKIDTYSRLRALVAPRTFLADIIETVGCRHGLAIDDLAGFWSVAAADGRIS